MYLASHLQFPDYCYLPCIKVIILKYCQLPYLHLVLVANDTTTTLPEIQAASIFLPPSLFAKLENTTKVGIGFTFYETAALFPLPDGSPSNLTIASAVIGALVAGQSFFNLPEPVNISLHLTIPVCSHFCLLVLFLLACTS